MQPLKDITVVALEHAIAAPFATRQLADLGARVVKIERPGSGDFARGYDARVRGLSSHFVWVNRSKESWALDLKDPRGREIMHRFILEKADVVVQNLAPGAADRLGLSYAALSAKKPELIVCDISGYGNDGPYENKKAYDLLIQSEAGFLSVTGTGEALCKAGPSIADIAAGMYAYTNILAALLHRKQTGRGQHVEISMLEALVEWMGYPMYYAFDGAAPPARTGAMHATIFPYGAFRVGDGSTVIFGLQNEREWSVFCEKVLCEPSLASDPRFAGNAKRNEMREELLQIITDVFCSLSIEDVIERLDGAQIANAKVNDMHDVWNHPQFQARKRWRTVDSPAGHFPALLPPGAWTQGDPKMGKIPELGEHTASILRELGCDEKFLATPAVPNVS